MLNGTGYLGLPTGALRLDNITGSDAALWQGEIALGAATDIGVDAPGDKLSLGGTGNNTSFNGFVTGANTLTEVGPGTLELGDASNNNYTGGTVINDGTLLLNKTDPGAAYQFKPYATGTAGVTVGNEGEFNGARPTLQWGARRGPERGLERICRRHGRRQHDCRHLVRFGGFGNEQ